MTTKQQEIQKEIDKLQEFIDAVEAARECNLELADSVYDKYNATVERQKELAKQLQAFESNGNGIYTSAQLLRKEAYLRTDPCKVEAVVMLPRSDFEEFKNHLYDSRAFIEAHNNIMYQDRDGLNHCILVLGEGHSDGVLVESEGSTYARYSALLPNAQEFMRQQIRLMADELIKEGTAHTENGSWLVGFDEISQHFDTTVTPTNGIGQMLIDELQSRDEISAVIATEDCIEMTTYLENAPIDADEDHLMTLFSLMGCNLEDVHIVDDDVEHDLATIVELNQDTLTEEGKREWADVLGAKVKRIFEGYYGTQIAVTGCDPERLEAFSKMLAGECTLSESNRWLNPAIDDEPFELKMQ